MDPASTYLLNLLADQIGIGGPSVPIALAARLGCCLGDCSGASDLASKSCGVTEGGSANFRTSAASFAIDGTPTPSSQLNEHT